jgi:glutamate carboxypeptidase
MDTVFDPGTAATRPYRSSGGRAYGPGVTDMKAGLLAGLHALNGQWPSVTVNAGVIEGGTRPNVVAERCEIEVDLRAATVDAFAAAAAEVERIAASPTVDGVSVTVERIAGHPPMEKSAASARLVDLAISIAGDLGFALADAATGGASDANTCAALGVPTLDGLGPVGGDDHSVDEWLDLSSVVPRTLLLATLIGRIEEAL